MYAIIFHIIDGGRLVVNMKDIIKLTSKPYIVKYKNTGKIKILLTYCTKYDKKYIFYLILMRQIILNSSYEYKTEKEYKKAYRTFMLIAEDLAVRKLKNNLFITFTLVIPNPKKVKSFDIDKAFKFFIDTIYKPNVVNNKHFNDKVFEREREFLKNDIVYSLKNVYSQSYQKFVNIVDDDGMLKDNIYNNMDMIDSANSEELYNIYKNIVIDNVPVVIVYGDVDKSINDVIYKNMNLPVKTIDIEYDYDNFLKPFEKTKDVTDDTEFNQSVLYTAYKIKNATKKDKNFLNIIKNILGSGSDSLLFKKLRLESGFVYSCKAWTNDRAGLLVIESYVNNDCKDKVVECLQDIFKSLKDKKFLQENIDRVAEKVQYSLIRDKDNINKKLNDFVNKLLRFGPNVEELFTIYKNMKVEELLEFLDRLTLDTIYFSRGEFNEKN